MSKSLQNVLKKNEKTIKISHKIIVLQKDAYFAKVFICKKYGAMLIVYGIVCGMGRSSRSAPGYNYGEF
jgi:hypothetical protein